LALKKHPDKQPNNPNAAAEFYPIQRAFDLLSDAKARAALDDLYRYDYKAETLQGNRVPSY
jgi:DnaJ family protein C protein 17